MKRKMKCTLKLIALMLVFTSIGGCSVNQKAHTKQAQTTTSSSNEEDTEVLKQKQLAYIKEHEQEIVDFVKAQNSKVESVQIDWDQTQWSDGGNGTPQGGDEVIEIFGTVNQLEDSGWRVDVVFDSDQKMTFSMGYNISIKGDYIE